MGWAKSNDLSQQHPIRMQEPPTNVEPFSWATTSTQPWAEWGRRPWNTIPIKFRLNVQMPQLAIGNDPYLITGQL
jgi:hypothetical protein